MKRLNIDIEFFASTSFIQKIDNFFQNANSVYSMNYLLAVLFFILSCSVTGRHNRPLLDKKITHINHAFADTNIAQFNSLFPIHEIQEIYKSIIDEKIIHTAGQSKIIRINQDSAIVFLSGNLDFGNSGDETNYSSLYSGLYLFQFINTDWQLTKKFDIGRQNKILKHKLNVQINPTQSISISDEILITTNDKLGFSVRLNYQARISQLTVNQHSVNYIFDGGVLWVESEKIGNHTLQIDYVLNVEQDENDRNSAYWGEEYGHVRNQYFWHPFFDFASPNDRADFIITATISAEYQLSSSLAQHDQIIADKRQITGKSDHPTFALSLYYDKHWKLNEIKKDGLLFSIYATDEFTPNTTELFNTYTATYENLKDEFGSPKAKYFSVVQDRSSGGNGWKNRSNNSIIAAKSGSYLIQNGANPRAVFGHEVAHAWTTPVGPAANFLSEGWATYAESRILSKIYGKESKTRFFESQQENYFSRNFNGHASLLDDYSNSGVSYSKGTWLFYMLEHQLGEASFLKAMRQFIESNEHTIEQFIASMNNYSKRDLNKQLKAWLTSKSVPKLSAKFTKSQIQLFQLDEIFSFPLEIEIRLKGGSAYIKEIYIENKTHLITIPEGDISAIEIDPLNKVLLQLTKK
jgi:hypothetical protein